jgi:hypothetical protein
VGCERGADAVGARLAAAHLCAPRPRTRLAHLLDSGIHTGTIPVPVFSLLLRRSRPSLDYFLESGIHTGTGT